jgi:hypothetical protein
MLDAARARHLNSGVGPLRIKTALYWMSRREAKLNRSLSGYVVGAAQQANAADCSIAIFSCCIVPSGRMLLARSGWLPAFGGSMKKRGNVEFKASTKASFKLKDHGANAPEQLIGIDPRAASCQHSTWPCASGNSIRALGWLTPNRETEGGYIYGGSRSSGGRSRNRKRYQG